MGPQWKSRGPHGEITWAPRGNHVGPTGKSRRPPGEITWAPRGNHVGPQGKSRGPHGEITWAPRGNRVGPQGKSRGPQREITSAPRGNHVGPQGKSRGPPGDIKKAKHEKNDAFELWCWRRLLRVPWTARRYNQSILKEISPEYLFEEMMLKTKLQSFGHLIEELTHWQRL